MHNAVAVTLKVVAIRMRRLRIAAPARVLHGVRSEHSLKCSEESTQQSAPSIQPVTGICFLLKTGLSDYCTLSAECLLIFLLCQSHLGRLELFLHFGQRVLIHFRLHGLVPLVHGSLPMGSGKLYAPGLLI